VFPGARLGGTSPVSSSTPACAPAPSSHATVIFRVPPGWSCAQGSVRRAAARLRLFSLLSERAPRATCSRAHLTAASACTWRWHSKLLCSNRRVVPLGRERGQGAHCAHPLALESLEALPPFRDSSGTHRAAAWVITRTTQSGARCGLLGSPCTQPSHHSTPACAGTPAPRRQPSCAASHPPSGSGWRNTAWCPFSATFGIS
jgi:hypothetical protein